MRKKDQGAAEPSFEKALAELESIVARMEDGGLSLEQSLAAHKRGLELARQCRARPGPAPGRGRTRAPERPLPPIAPDRAAPAYGTLRCQMMHKPSKQAADLCRG